MGLSETILETVKHQRFPVTKARRGGQGRAEVLARLGVHRPARAPELTDLAVTSAPLQEPVERITSSQTINHRPKVIRPSRWRIDRSQPIADALIPKGHRVHDALEKDQPRVLGRQDGVRL